MRAKKAPATAAKPTAEVVPAEKNYITPPGYKKLEDELIFLRHTRRPEVVNALADAAAEGDRSENAEYIYRKKQLREVDRRLRFLAKRLDVAVVVDPREQTRVDRVFFGATVQVEDENGVIDSYRIVGVDEIEGKDGDISWRSPIGSALLGKELHDAVMVRWHAGHRELTITGISYRVPAQASATPAPAAKVSAPPTKKKTARRSPRR